MLAGAAEIGTGVHTTLSQICAEAIGVPLADVDYLSVDTDMGPFDSGAISDRTTVHLGSAVYAAAMDARRQILEAAGELLEIDPKDLDIVNGLISPSGSPSKGISIQQAVAYCHSKKGGPIIGRGRHLQEGLHPLDPETGQSPKAASHYKFGAQAVEVEVDPETGRLTVLKVVSVHDCGRAINPLHVEGQIEGAVAQGLGFALYEEVKFDGGQIVNPSLMEYGVPMSVDVPKIESIILETGYPEGPFGAKGAGEPGIIGVAAAIGNALYDAVGVRVYDLPITWEKVLDAIGAGRRCSDETLAI